MTNRISHDKLLPNRRPLWGTYEPTGNNKQDCARRQQLRHDLAYAYEFLTTGCAPKERHAFDGDANDPQFHGACTRCGMEKKVGLMAEALWRQSYPPPRTDGLRIVEGEPRA